MYLAIEKSIYVYQVRRIHLFSLHAQPNVLLVAMIIKLTTSLLVQQSITFLYKWRVSNNCNTLF